MVLLQIHSECVTLLELESDAPWTVHMDRVPRRSLAAQPVKVESREMKIRWHGRRVQSIEHQDRSCLKIRTHPAASSFFE
jgi:hypothetical protein